MPKKLDDCVKKVMADGKTESQAYAICQANVNKEAVDKAFDFEDEEYDPTPWCSGCGAMTSDRCPCGPIADND